MKLKYKIMIGIYVIFGSLIALFLFYYMASSFAPGSYARAEIYELEISEDTLIQIINEIKLENPKLDLNKNVLTQNIGLNDGREDSQDHWYHIYFYHQEKNQIIYTWTRKRTRTTTSFAFVSINNGLTLGNWTAANKEFWWWKNREIKEEFEKLILRKIEQKIKERKPNTGS